jgi:hypothetical protein
MDLIVRDFLFFYLPDPQLSAGSPTREDEALILEAYLPAYVPRIHSTWYISSPCPKTQPFLVNTPSSSLLL